MTKELELSKKLAVLHIPTYRTQIQERKIMQHLFLIGENTMRRMERL